MQLQLTGHHFEITEAIRERVNSKMDKLTHHFERITTAHMILGLEKGQHTAELNVHVNGEDFFAQSTQENLYKAIDTLMDKVERQLRKSKGKKHNYHQNAVHPDMIEDDTSDNSSDTAGTVE